MIILIYLLTCNNNRRSRCVRWSRCCRIRNKMRKSREPQLPIGYSAVFRHKQKISSRHHTHDVSHICAHVIVNFPRSFAHLSSSHRLLCLNRAVMYAVSAHTHTHLRTSDTYNTLNSRAHNTFGQGSTNNHLFRAFPPSTTTTTNRTVVFRALTRLGDLYTTPSTPHSTHSTHSTLVCRDRYCL